jgi:hypothetical protein
MSKKAKLLLLIIASYLHKNLYTAKYFLSKDSSNAIIECAVSSSICKNVLQLTKSAKNSLAICHRQPNRKYFVKGIACISDPMQLNAHEISALRDHAKDSQYCMTNFYGKLGLVGFGRAARTRILG